MEGLIHILTAPPTTIEQETKQLDQFDKYQKKYLSRRCCGLCELPLDRIGCGAHLVPACEEKIRIKRRKQCLKEFKPRLNMRKKLISKLGRELNG